VVDDEVELAEVLQEYFLGQGYEVRTAHSGLEAIARAEKEKPDLILLDIRMPGMDGVEVLRRIRETDDRVGFIMITAYEDVERAWESLQLGAFDYISKPFDFEYLQRAVSQWMTTCGVGTEKTEQSSQPPELSSSGRVYDLALEIFKFTRVISPDARSSLGTALQAAALDAVLKAAQGENPAAARALKGLGILLDLGRDLGEVPEAAHRELESHVAKALRSVGGAS